MCNICFKKRFLTQKHNVFLIFNTKISKNKDRCKESKGICP